MEAVAQHHSARWSHQNVARGAEWLWSLAFAAGAFLAISSPSPEVPMTAALLASPLVLSLLSRMFTSRSLGSWVAQWMVGADAAQAEALNHEKMQADAALGMAAIEASQPREHAPLEMDGDEEMPSADEAGREHRPEA